jgi:CRISPR-associated protein Cas2
MTMYYNVCYDISKNKTRLLAVRLCKQAGLVRIQRSVFAGASTPARINLIVAELKPLLQAKTDALSIQPLDAQAWRNWQRYGKTMDKKMVARQEGVIIL